MRNLNEERVLDAIFDAPGSTGDEIYAAVMIPRSTAKRYITSLLREGKIHISGERGKIGGGLKREYSPGNGLMCAPIPRDPVMCAMLGV